MESIRKDKYYIYVSVNKGLHTYCHCPCTRDTFFLLQFQTSSFTILKTYVNVMTLFVYFLFFFLQAYLKSTICMSCSQACFRKGTLIFFFLASVSFAVTDPNVDCELHRTVGYLFSALIFCCLQLPFHITIHMLCPSH